MKSKPKKYPNIWEASAAVSKAMKTRVTGECYAASVAVYNLAGKSKSKLKLYGSDSHFWLRGPYGVFIDLTAGQFNNPIKHYIDGEQVPFPSYTESCRRGTEDHIAALVDKAKPYLQKL